LKGPTCANKSDGGVGVTGGLAGAAVSSSIGVVVDARAWALAVSTAFCVWVASKLICSDNPLVSCANGLAVTLAVGGPGVQALRKLNKKNANMVANDFQAMVGASLLSQYNTYIRTRLNPDAVVLILL
jgi:hypothetical protein